MQLPAPALPQILGGLDLAGIAIFALSGALLAARLGRLPGVGLTAGLNASNSADSASASVPAPGSQPTALRVDGSLRRERDRVRASVRVVVVRVDSTAWSGAFEGSMDSLFEFQTRVTDATFAAVNAVRRGLSEQ